MFASFNVIHASIELGSVTEIYPENLSLETKEGLWVGTLSIKILE
jgi:hypothetical protein